MNKPMGYKPIKSKLKHVVSLSGGIGSFFTAIRVVEKYGLENTDLVFCDTKTEDPDLYRFLDDIEKYFNKKIIKLVDGRDIWEVAYEENFIFNSRVASCTKKLKRNIFRKWLKANYKPNDCIIHLGFGIEEMHRVEKSKKNYLPYIVECLLTEEPYLSKNDMFNELEKLNIEIPYLYKLGFSHNNCGGFCFKAGVGHFKNLYEKLPERYMYHAKKEEELRQIIYDKTKRDVSILTRTKNGRKYNITLLGLAEVFDIEKLSDDEVYDIGGCNCFID